MFTIRSLLFILITVALFHACSTIPSKTYPRNVYYLTASYYGPKFHGRPTSSGERFDMYAMTCAHKEMPFGTKLRVTNLDKDRSVVVTVNDRGPFIPGRDLDLSYGAAREIGLVRKGVGRVKVEHLGRDMSYVKRVPYVSGNLSGFLTIQVGSFTEKSNADRLREGLITQYDDVFIDTAMINGRTYHRVRVGKFSDRDTIHELSQKLALEGYSILITSR